MESVLLVIHLLLAIALIITILLQRSEGGALGIGGGGGGGGQMSVRGQANLLTRATAVLATLFILTSLGLAILGGTHNRGGSVLDRIDTTTPSGPAAPITPATPTAPVAPAAPAETPSAPAARAFGPIHLPLSHVAAFRRYPYP